jgi:hypothetical protein
MKKYDRTFLGEEIEPSTSVKSRLDKAFKAHYFPRKEIRLPYLQSVAAAILLLISGIGIGRWFDKPEPTVERIVQQVKFIDRPVKEIRYIQVPVQNLAMKTSHSENSPNDSVKTVATNDLAVTEVSDASYGISMGDDSLLQKMMVTIY